MEYRFALRTITSPTGRQTGYEVYDLETGATVARFTNRQLCTWRNAKRAAETRRDELNRSSNQGL